MAQLNEMLEAHIRFEVDRWGPERVAATLAEEVDAVLDALAPLTVGEVLPAAETAAGVAAAIGDVEVTDALLGLTVDILLAARAAVAADPVTVADTVRAEDLHAIVDLLSELDDLRGALVRAVTDNPAYHELIAHVLYQGVKAFMLTENVVARRLPGAQSLIRLGQRGLSSAAPGLESTVDRQLSRFVQNQIGATLNDSREFLEETLAGEPAHELVDTMLRTSGRTRLAEAADIVSDADVQALTEHAEPLLRHVLSTGLLARLLTPAIDQVLTVYAPEPVTGLLEELGLERDVLIEHLVTLATPAITAARESGAIEEWARARLTPFYTAWAAEH